jgi:geranylgeranyl diphosphate synthase type I
MMRYQFGWVASDGSEEPGPPPARFYGTLCVEGAACTQPADLDGAAEAIALVGAAVELMRESMEVHEDMQVGEANSEERAAIWWLWGPAQAINVGDGLHALARLAAFRARERGLAPERTLAAVNTLDAMALRYYEGQYLELTYQERVDITEKQYLTMAESRSGALIGGTAALGAVAAGASDDTVRHLHSFGERLGVALQIREDVAAIWAAADHTAGQARLLNKSKLFPVVHGLAHGELALKRQLGTLYFKRVMEPSDVESLRSILDEMGARAYAEEQVKSQTTEAIDTLDKTGLPDDAKQRWAEIAQTLVGS